MSFKNLLQWSTMTLLGLLFFPLQSWGQCDTLEASFSSTAPACMGEGIDFLNTGTDSTHAHYVYTWDFGPNATPTTSNVENPQNVVFDSAGVEKITLTIEDTSCGAIAQESNGITIHEEPTADFSSTAPACEEEDVDFNNTGSSDSKWEYSWDFGKDSDPNTSTAENPKGIKYTSAGSKTITFTISSDHCSDTRTGSITINNDPDASFSSTTPACEMDSIDFSNTGSSGGWNYDWNFGSGATPDTSDMENPTGVIYSSKGNKTVQFIISDANCEDTATQSITINDKPDASFTATAPACEETEVDFNNTGSSDNKWSYSWDFGADSDPNSSTAENPEGIMYSESGAKTVTFTISDGTCMASDTNIVMIQATPDADFTSTAPTCTGDTMSFTYTGSTNANDTYDWTFGSGANPATSTDQNPTGVEYSTAGTKQVELVVQNSATACTDTVRKPININFTPEVDFSSSAPECAGNNVSFTNEGTSGDKWSYSWGFGSGADPSTSSAENPSGIQYSKGGQKTITFTITDETCINTDTGTISIDTLPFVEAGQDTTICAERKARIGTSAAPTVYNYQWKPTSTLDDPTVPDPLASPEASFTTYHLRVTDPSTGCVSRDSITVTMLNSLMASAGPDQEICADDSVQIGAAKIEGQSYMWTPDTMISNAYISNPIVNPDTTTTYTVTVIDTSASQCDPITDDVRVTVNPLPEADAGEDDTITRGASLQLVATGGIMYEWTPLEGLSDPGISDPVASPDSTTDYIVKVTDVNACVNYDTVTIGVVEPNFFIPSAFTPNGDGKNDVWRVRSRGLQDFSLTVYDRWGEMVFQTTNPNEGWNGKKIGTLQEMPEGAYVYSVEGVLTNGKPISKQGMVNLIR